MTFHTIRWEVDAGVGTLTMNRSDHLNGMTNLMLHETAVLLRAVAADDTVAVVVVTGAGRAFCPGADLKHYTSEGSGEPDHELTPEDFDVPGSEVAARAARLAGSAPLARRAMKAHYVAAADGSFADLVALETEAHLRITQSADCKEAFRAFVEKRTPQFQGR